MGTILSTPGIDSLGTHKFSHKGSQRETIAECVSVDFRRVLRSTKFRPGGNLSQWREALHALVALYNTCLPNITPELLYSTVCSRDARSLMLVMSPEAALEDLCFRYGARSLIEDITLESNIVSSTTASPVMTSSDPVKSKRGTGDVFGSPAVVRSPKDCLTAAEGDQNMANPLSDDEKDEKSPEKSPRKSDIDNEWQQVEYTEEEEEAAQEVCPNCRKSKYANIFSDESDSSESEDNQSDSDTSSNGNSSEDEDQYIEGSDSFLESVHKRKSLRSHNIDNRVALNLDNVGIENLLFASVTFEKRVLNDERISCLTVLSVRKRFRGLKLGQFLVQLVIKLAGSLDPLVVLADDDAVEFFEKQGFINDPMICCRYDELKKEGSWTNCTVMVKLPKLIPEVQIGTEDLSMDNIEEIVNKKVEKWQKEALNLYQQQVALITQLKKEIITGREKMNEQQNLIKILTEDLSKQYSNGENSQSASTSKIVDIARNDISLVESQIEKLNLDSVIKEFEQIATGWKSEAVSSRGDISNEYIVVTPVSDQPSEKFRVDLEPEVSFIEENENDNFIESQEENFDKILEIFSSSLKSSNAHLFHQIKVTNIHAIKSQQSSKITKTEKEQNWVQLFYSGSLLSLSDLNSIRDKGRFTNFNFTYGDYGIGLYFSRFAEVSVKFSKVNCAIVALVNPGNQNSTLKADSSRRSAGDNFDSLLTPGRLSELASPRDKTGDSFKEKCQELIIFDIKRAKPQYVIEYIIK